MLSLITFLPVLLYLLVIPVPMTSTEDALSHISLKMNSTYFPKFWFCYISKFLHMRLKRLDKVHTDSWLPFMFKTSAKFTQIAMRKQNLFCMKKINQHLLPIAHINHYWIITCPPKLWGQYYTYTFNYMIDKN